MWSLLTIYHIKYELFYKFTLLSVPARVHRICVLPHSGGVGCPSSLHDNRAGTSHLLSLGPPTLQHAHAHLCKAIKPASFQYTSDWYSAEGGVLAQSQVERVNKQSQRYWETDRQTMWHWNWCGQSASKRPLGWICWLDFFFRWFAVSPSVSIRPFGAGDAIITINAAG